MKNGNLSKNAQALFGNKLMKLLESVFIQKPSYLVIFIWFWVIILSSIKEIINIPSSYLSNKKNILNQLFVKWGWAWTLLVVGSYMILTSYVYSALSRKNTILRSLIRLLIGTFAWYFWAQVVFHLVENLTGICVNRFDVPNFNISQKVECIRLKGGHLWKGFDISGHCFLLIYSFLLMNSELQIQKNWINIENSLSNYLIHGSKSSIVFKQRYLFTFNYVMILFVLNCLLISIWFVMLSATCLYFHTFFSKIVGTICAIISWMATYNEWFKHSYSPGLPADGPLHGLLPKSILKHD